MTHVLELLVDRSEGRVQLRSPEVGTFSRALPAGALLGPRAAAGVLHSLGQSFALVTPAGVLGRVLNAPPERLLAPVGYGTLLYELAPLEAETERAAEARAAERDPGALLFRAPYSGRFWQRPSPGDPPFARVGDVLEDGRTLGLIEVMKTFTHLVYRAGGELPARARVLRFLAQDGAEVEDGSALLELEAL